MNALCPRRLLAAWQCLVHIMQLPRVLLQVVKFAEADLIEGKAAKLDVRYVAQPNLLQGTSVP